MASTLLFYFKKVKLDGWDVRIECFHMTSRRPYWCPKTMKRRPCWCPKPVLREMNSFLMQMLSFVPKHLHRWWPREWKHSITIWNSFNIYEALRFMMYSSHIDMIYKKCALQDIDIFIAAFFFILVSTSWGTEKVRRT